MKTCSFEGCNRKHDCHGLCKTHNKQLADGKELTPVKESLPQTDRFISKIDKSDGCWIWTGYKVRGYGRFDVNQRNKVFAHRYAYNLWVGEVPADSVVHHKCANRACCNPDHLQLTTQQDNLAEMFARRAYEVRIAELEARIAELEKELIHAS